MFGLIKKAFLALLSFSGSMASMANASNFSTCISLNNQLCMARHTLINTLTGFLANHLWLI